MQCVGVKFESSLGWYDVNMTGEISLATQSRKTRIRTSIGRWLEEAKTQVELTSMQHRYKSELLLFNL